MSAERTFHRPSVTKAIEQWHAGTLGELETHRLKDLLRDDPAARQLFIEYGDMLAALDFTAGSELPADKDAFALRALDADRKGWASSGAWTLGTVVLASVLCLMLMAGVFLAGREAPSVAVLPAMVPPAAVLTEFFTIGREESAVGQEAVESEAVEEVRFEVGRRFLPDEEFIIPGAEQFVRLKLAQGVELLVQGPATLLFDAGNSVRLKQGQLVGTVPPAGVGFIVYLPHGQVQDLGTVFGVSASETDSSVTVLSGKVSCRLSRPGHPLLESVFIHSGESVRLDPERAAPILLVDADEPLNRIAGIHSGIRETAGDVRFSAAQPPVPRERRSIDAGKILVFQESRQIPLSWDSMNKNFFHLDDTAFSGANILLKQAIPEHQSLFLAASPDSGLISIDSYLVSMSSLGKGTMILSGTMTFQNEILAVFTSRDGLVATDHFSSQPEFAAQWKEESPAARGSHETNDEVVVMEDQHTLKVTLQASGAGDQLRVLVRSGGHQP